MRIPLRAAILLSCWASIAGAQQASHPDSAALQRLLTVEDARATGPSGAIPLLDGLASHDTLLRRVAARAIGRLQRPEYVARLATLLNDPVPAIRATAADAIAQAVSRATRRATDSLRPAVRDAAAILHIALGVEHDDSVAATIATALGRLAYADTAEAREAATAIVARAHGRPAFGFVWGLFALAAPRGITPGAISYLRAAALPPAGAETRRVAVLALGVSGGLDSAATMRAAHDRDAQVRRLALAGVRNLSAASRAAALRAAFVDPSQIVRIAAVGAARAGIQRPDCAPIVKATRDRSDHVALTAIDALGMPCADDAAASTALAAVATTPPRSRFAGHAWQRRAHAVAALAKLDSARAAPFVTLLAHGTAPERTWAATAAANSRNVALLRTLVHDADNNVREAAITGLARLTRHDDDTLFVFALGRGGNQAVLAAATALRGSRDAAALPAILDAFDSLSARRSENARDPRLALLERIGEMGSLSTSTRLTPYLADFDTTVAATAARIMSKWTGTSIVAHPNPLPLRDEPLAAIFLAPDIRLRVTMAASTGGGSFTVRLYPADAPATVARIVRLVRAHYYDGHVFQRVEPDFVVQGGGPDASEYVGDSTFMRDELTGRSHLRGTLGISSRGRDTGDAQWFINLTDNTRLDHLYTVFGTVISGLDVVDRILEGDTIAKVEVAGGP